MQENLTSRLPYFCPQPIANRKQSNTVSGLSFLIVFCLVFASATNTIGKTRAPKNVNKTTLVQKASVVEVEHQSGKVDILNRNVSVAGRFNKFVVVQTVGDSTIITNVNTKLNVINAHDVSRDGVYITYETNDPDYRTVVENLVTGEVKTLSENFVTDISRISPVKNEAVALTMRQDETGSSVNGLVLVNLKTGKERLLVERNVAGPIVFSADGRTVFYNEERKTSRLATVNSGETVELEVTFYVPAKVSLGKGKSSSLRLSDLPFEFPQPAKVLSETQLSTPLDIQAVDENDVLKHAFADHGETIYRTPDRQTEIISAGGSDLQSVRVKNSRTKEVVELPSVEGASLLGVQNGGVIVWQQNQQKTSINFVDFSGRTAELAAASSVSHNLPIKSSRVTQGGASYPYPGNCNTNGGSHTVSSGLNYAYDFQGSYNAHVMASAKGRVVHIDNTVTCSRLSTCRAADDPYRSGCGGSLWGNYIIVRHDDGSRTLYAHLRSNSMNGKFNYGYGVCQGQYLADQGHTGYMISSSCGDHLHHQKMNASDSNLKYISPSVWINYSDQSNPLSCRSYTSASTEVLGNNGIGSYSLYASPNYITVSRGSVATYNIYAYSYNGFRGQLPFYALNLPGNQVLNGTGFYPGTVNVTADYTYFGTALKIYTNSNTPTGTHYITIQTRTCDRIQNIVVTLRVI